MAMVKKFWYAVTISALACKCYLFIYIYSIHLDNYIKV